MKATVKVPESIMKEWVSLDKPDRLKINGIMFYHTSLKFNGKDVELEPSDWDNYDYKLKGINIHFPKQWIQEQVVKEDIDISKRLDEIVKTLEKLKQEVLNLKFP